MWVIERVRQVWLCRKAEKTRCHVRGVPNRALQPFPHLFHPVRILGQLDVSRLAAWCDVHLLGGYPYCLQLLAHIGRFGLVVAAAHCGRGVVNGT